MIAVGLLAGWVGEPATPVERFRGQHLGDAWLATLNGRLAQPAGLLVACVGTLDPAAVGAAYLADPDGFQPLLAEPAALALWDRDRRRLLLARDALGWIPLCYAATPLGCVWADLPPRLRAAGAGGAEFDLAALADALVTGQPAAPDTLWRGIRQVEPGTLVTWAAGRQRIVRLPAPRPVTVAAPREVLRAALDSAERPTVLLSGGLDSAWLAALAPRPATSVHTTMAPWLAQADHATPLAGQLHLPHRRVGLTAAAAQTWASLVRSTGLPLDSLGPIALATAVAAAAAAGATILLSGLGADELTGGRGLSRALRWTSWRHGARGQVAAAATALYGARPWHFASWHLRWHLRAELWAAERLAAQPLLGTLPPRPPRPPQELAGLPAGRAAAAQELAGRIAGGHLPVLSRLAWQHDLSLRAPYLEPGPRAGLAAWPWPARLGGKPRLRQAAAADLPDDVVSRPKLDRRLAEVELLLSDPLPAPFDQALSPAALGARGWFDPVTVHLWLRLVRRRPLEPLNRLRTALLLQVAAAELLASDYS
ncbi:MAG: hypothetical protein IT204_03930 [Fimbriimonadaceae bacterium]|nr:hypothetical protein [Fimbriimonadaceae bacterium]